ncbi:MAG: hypothetical protein AB7U46_03075 [Paenirhodobacter sp.]|uniref:hypothetical protein n=1 Tax=Paenirhodobacter sp. TaxID=1965326 RepID=UPI003D117661
MTSDFRALCAVPARRFHPVSTRLAALLGAALLALTGLSTAAAAQAVPAGYAPRAVVIRNDMGGDVGARANKIAAMRAAGQSVEIRGSACYSACTMYLALPGTCVNRRTQFGFHRPSYYGIALAPDQFEFWSQVIAAHYPPAIRSWYLREARYAVSPEILPGAELIRLGVPECP